LKANAKNQRRRAKELEEERKSVPRRPLDFFVMPSEYQQKSSGFL
jgi:hypothetical protein